MKAKCDNCKTTIQYKEAEQLKWDIGGLDKTTDTYHGVCDKCQNYTFASINKPKKIIFIVKNLQKFVDVYKDIKLSKVSKMMFGRYNGKMVYEVPQDYYDWAIKELNKVKVENKEA